MVAPITTTLTFAGGQAGLLQAHGDLQLIIWDEAWPDGTQGSRARPSLTRFVTRQTLAELDALRDHMARLLDQMEGIDGEFEG